MIHHIYKGFKAFCHSTKTLFYCLCTGIKYNNSFSIVGRPIVIRKNWFKVKFFHKENGTIQIGQNFKCNNKVSSNTIGLIQPCVFNISTPGSKIVLGDNVGISGSTINATKKVTIGNNVLIGSGCLITDTDSHPIDPMKRLENPDSSADTISKPIVIGNNVFIGARTIILKGVTIGENSVIGAGSVVSGSIPANCIAAGNPCKVIKQLTI